MSGRQGNDWFDARTPGDGADVINGGSGSDTVSYVDRTVGVELSLCTAAVSAGNDFLFGDFGEDDLSGGDGDDYLDGALGVDLINGGASTGDIRIVEPGELPTECEL